jgi:peptidoglycan/xylan/chitin deacetylase (PgdA/CDA1 family)
VDLRVQMLEPAQWLERILDQEGVPFEVKGHAKVNELDQDIVYTVSGELSKVPAKLIITNHKALGTLLGQRVRRTSASEFAHSGNRGHAFIKVFSGNVSELKSFRELGYHRDRFGNKIPMSGILLGEIDGRHLISLPWNMRKFPSHWSRWSIYLTRMHRNSRLFCETVPLVDDRVVREAVFEALTLGYKAIKAPLVRVTPRIAGPGYIAVRIDADGYSEVSTEKVSGLAKSLDIPFSWFIDTWSWRKESPAIRELSQSNEVGLHSYFHATSIWRNSNLRNLRRGFRFLKALGVTKSGFVSPYGHWNPGLRDAMSIAGVHYSSEFAFSCDVLPSKSDWHSSSSPLQIPTIPISLGVWTGSASYWDVLREEIEIRLAQSGFAVLYDHPLGRLEHQVDNLRLLIDEMASRGHVFVTMSQLGQIFAARPRIVSAVWDGERVKYEIEGEVGQAFFVESVWGDSIQETQEGASSLLGIGRQNSYSIEWGTTFFFGILATFPVGLHIFWATIRRIPSSFLAFVKQVSLKLQR